MSGHKLWQTKNLIDDKLCLIHQILEARVQSQFEEAKNNKVKIKPRLYQEGAQQKAN